MHPALRRSAEQRLGLFTAVDARTAGYQHPEIRKLLATGRWVQLRRGVYVTAGAPPQRRTAPDTAWTRSPSCFTSPDPERRLSHGTAARLWGLPVRRDLPPLVRLTDPERWRRGEGIHVTRAPLSAAEVATPGPFQLTAPTRTVVDCARERDLEDAVVAADAALLAERTTPAELRQAVDGIRHWPGAARAARAMGLADGRAESPLETRGRLRIVGAGLTAPGPERRRFAAVPRQRGRRQAG